MFYSTQILARKGPLGLVWIAAHMDRQLKRHQIYEADIVITCDSIINPEAPLALRLSGQLLLGIVRIYERQVRYLQQDCESALLKIRVAIKPLVNSKVDLPSDAAIANEEAITAELQGLDDDSLLPAAGGGLLPGIPLQQLDFNALTRGLSTTMSGRYSASDAWATYSVSGTTQQEVFEGADKQIPFDLDEIEVERLRSAPEHSAQGPAAAGPSSVLDDLADFAGPSGAAAAMRATGAGTPGNFGKQRLRPAGGDADAAMDEVAMPRSAGGAASVGRSTGGASNGRLDGWDSATASRQASRLLVGDDAGGIRQPQLDTAANKAGPSQALPTPAIDDDTPPDGLGTLDALMDMPLADAGDLQFEMEPSPVGAANPDAAVRDRAGPSGRAGDDNDGDDEAAAAVGEEEGQGQLDQEQRRGAARQRRAAAAAQRRSRTGLLKRKVIIDEADNGAPATQLSSTSIRNLLSDRSSLLRERGLILLASKQRRRAARHGAVPARHPAVEAPEWATGSSCPALYQPGASHRQPLCGPLQALLQVAIAAPHARGALAEQQQEQQQQDQIGSPMQQQQQQQQQGQRHNALAGPSPLTGGGNSGGVDGGMQWGAADDVGGFHDEPALVHSGAALPTPPGAPAAPGGAHHATQVTFDGTGPSPADVDDGGWYDPSGDAGPFSLEKENVAPGSSSEERFAGDASASRAAWAAAVSSGPLMPHTRQTLSQLQSVLSSQPEASKRRKGNAGADVALPDGKGKAAATGIIDLTSGMSRLQASRTFFELLVLRSKGLVSLEQQQPPSSGRRGAVSAAASQQPLPVGDITIRLTAAGASVDAATAAAR